MHHVFNMGIGMVAVVAADKADVAMRTIKTSKHKAWIIGEIQKGSSLARLS
jgi:phosphoribosylformylglycinamidine cyclo-ligase